MSSTLQLSRHPLFESWTDPKSGVVSYLLARRVAPLQQSFYFVNPSLSADNRWLWFYAAYPPAPYRVLGAVCLDSEKPDIRVFPQTGFFDSSPLVAPEGDAAYFCMRESVWRIGVDGQLDRLCTLRRDYIAQRKLHRLATHLTLSSDGRYFLLDGFVGNHAFVAIGERATGDVRVIKEFMHMTNHAQFAPHDPELFIIAHDWTHDIVTGRRFHYDTRIWLMDIHDRRYEPLTPQTYCKHMTGISHEWWMRDGKIGYVDYEKGAFELDLATRTHTRVWPTPLCHAHCDQTARFWVADQSPYLWDQRPCEVLFLDRKTGRSIAIASELPKPEPNDRLYHVDPHPQFSRDGQFIIYTTTIRGRIDVAITPVAELRERLS